MQLAKRQLLSSLLLSEAFNHQAFPLLIYFASAISARKGDSATSKLVTSPILSGVRCGGTNEGRNHRKNAVISVGNRNENGINYIVKCPIHMWVSMCIQTEWRSRMPSLLSRSLSPSPVPFVCSDLIVFSAELFVLASESQRRFRVARTWAQNQTEHCWLFPSDRWGFHFSSSLLPLIILLCRLFALFSPLIYLLVVNISNDFFSLNYQYVFPLFDGWMQRRNVREEETIDFGWLRHSVGRK